MIIRKHLFVGVVAIFLTLVAASVRAQDAKPSPSPKLSPSPAPNISPEKLALIKELMELTNSQKTIDGMLKVQAEEMEKHLPDAVWAAASAMPELAKLSELDRESIRMQVVTSALEASRKLNGLIMQKLDFNKLITDISVPLHDKYFTESELRDLVVFYKSSTGQKVIDVMPKLFADSIAQIGETVVPKIMEVVNQLEREETQRMRKEVLEAVKIKAKPARPARRGSRTRSKH